MAINKRIGEDSKFNWITDFSFPNFEIKKNRIAQITYGSLKEDIIYDLGFSAKKGKSTKKQINIGVLKDEIIPNYLNWLKINKLKSGEAYISQSHLN